MGRKTIHDEPMSKSYPLRMTEEQYKRILKTNDAAERIRRFIDSWDMAESPEQLEIEAAEEEKEALRLLASVQDKRSKARLLRDGDDDKTEDIKEAYDRLGIGHRERERQIAWLEGVWNMTTTEAKEWLAYYGPGDEEADDD